MKIKVNNKIYDSKEQPIMIILSAQDKVNINAMLTHATKYCSYNPEKYNGEYIKNWMEKIE